jgi:CRP/FNR family transcriptional regulator
MSAAAPIKSDCIDFLGLMTAPKRSQVLAGSTPITYSAGSVAYMPGQPDYASVIASGLARVYVASASGREATVYYFHRGELLGKGIVPRSPVRVHVQAVTETEVTSLDVSLLRDLAARDIEISTALLTNYAALLAHAARIIAVRSFGDITERLAFDLLDRACRTQLISGRLVVRASQQQLADSIGSVREVVARSLRKMKDEGLVATAANLVRVLDVERLEEIANQGAPV